MSAIDPLRQDGAPSAPHVQLVAVDGQRVEQQHHIKLTLAPSAKSFHWNEKTVPLSLLEDQLASHDIREKKDGDCFVGATLLGGKRNKNSVDEVWVLTYDIDGSMSWDEVYEPLDKLAYNSYLYTTFSHLSERTEVVVDQYERWAKSARQPETPTLESLLAFLKANQKGHLKEPKFDKFKGFDRVADKGNVYVVTHDPVDKLRVVVVLEKPIRIGSLAASNAKALEAYKAIYHGVAAHIGLRDYDHSCSDPSRLFYFPSCPESKKQFAKVIGFEGKFIDWESVPRADGVEKPANDNKPAGGQKNADAPKPRIEFNGFNLRSWSGNHDATYDVETLVERKLNPAILGIRDKGGFYVTCPFESEHGDTGGQGTFVANGGDEHPAWEVHCSHNSCTSERRERLHFLQEWLNWGVLSLEDLGDVPPTQDDILAMVDALQKGALSKTWEPIVDALVRLSLKPLPFDDDVLSGIVEKTGKRIKTKLDKLLKSKRCEMHRDKFGFDDESSGTFINYDTKPFGVYAGKAKQHLIAENTKSPTLFVRGTDFVRIDADTNTKARTIVTCGKDEIRAAFNKVTTWGSYDHEGNLFYKSCPKDVSEDFFATEAASHSLPYLRDVLDTPFFDRDGNRVDAAGYHESSGIYLAPTSGLVIPRVSDEPTPEEIAKARDLLVMDLYGDFPFSDGEGFDYREWEAGDRLQYGKGSRANQIAKTLQPFVAEMIHGSMPLHATDAPIAGTGKSLMEDVCAIVACGMGTQVTQFTDNEEEMQKKIHTLAMEGAKRVVFGNIKIGMKVASGALAAAQTSGSGNVSGRILGKSRTGSGPWRCVAGVDGNNLTFSEEVGRRTLMVRLDASLRDPTKGRTFKQAMPLEAWAKERRGDLIAACLTLIQAWIVAGKPLATDNILASFESYCQVMGGILKVAGIEGFNTNRECVTVEEQVDEFQYFAGEWLRVFGTTEVKVGTCTAHDEREPIRFNTYGEKCLVELLLDVSDTITLGLFDNPNTASLGKRLGLYLRQYKGRIFDIDGTSYRVTVRPKDGVNLYRLAPLDRKECLPDPNRKPRNGPREPKATVDAAKIPSHRG